MLVSQLELGSFQLVDPMGYETVVRISLLVSQPLFIRP